jgi:hypothetical protein
MGSDPREGREVWRGPLDAKGPTPIGGGAGGRIEERVGFLGFWRWCARRDGNRMESLRFLVGNSKFWVRAVWCVVGGCGLLDGLPVIESDGFYPFIRPEL